MKNAILAVSIPLLLVPVVALSMNYGVNYQDSVVNLPICPAGETVQPILPNYSSVRSVVQGQLRVMKLNGVDTIRTLVGWGDDYSSGFDGVAISPPTTVVPSSYFTNANLFLNDVAAAGIPNVIVYLGGAGSYDPANCANNLSGLIIPTFQNGLGKFMSQVVNGTGAHPNIKIDLTNEIAPSSYESTCSQTSRTTFIQSVWSYYVDHYGNSRASFSSILDDSTDFRVAGNRLGNLITAVAATGRSAPTWFDVHAYGTRAQATRMLRGVYQIYSDHGYLSNQPSPKETVVGESFYEDLNNALGIADYLTTYDGYAGGRIGLSTVMSWPLKNPIGCANAFNVAPPYKTSVYKNVIAYGMTTMPVISASPNPVVIPSGQTTGFATISWTVPGNPWISVPVMIDGAAQIGFSGGIAPGSQGTAPAANHVYTFQLYPALPPDGHPDTTHLLDAVNLTAHY